jgi:tetratricopeptide (TPR) repeat protein
LPEQPWARFVAGTLAAAEVAGVDRYVLDLRANAGGDASWVTPFVNGLAGGRYDRFGRLMVLIGGSTFSAAQTLVNQLERYTEACFVGEPSGAAPTHFGDSKKVVLEASGLTLRVSTRYWPNWLAGEFREATEAHVDAVASSEDYFAGRDPALAAALGYDPPARVPAQVEDLLRRGKTQAGILRFMRHVSDPRVEDLEGPAFVAAGHRLLDEGLVREGRILFVLAAEYLPASAEAEAGWGRALELEGDPEAAARHYGRALALDPRNAAAAEALARLAPAEGGASPPGP